MKTGIRYHEERYGADATFSTEGVRWMQFDKRLTFTEGLKAAENLGLPMNDWQFYCVVVTSPFKTLVTRTFHKSAKDPKTHTVYCNLCAKKVVTKYPDQRHVCFSCKKEVQA